jgi:hypothetical protein
MLWEKKRIKKTAREGAENESDFSGSACQEYQSL